MRWRIGLAGDSPFTVAGLWREWNDPNGGKTLSFAMLTANADDHPLVKRFHRSGDEKRSVVIAPPNDHASWQPCRSTDEARSFLRLYPADLMRADDFHYRRASLSLDGQAPPSRSK